MEFNIANSLLVIYPAESNKKKNAFLGILSYLTVTIGYSEFSIQHSELIAHHYY
jgi:hypothetical protein